MQQNIKKILWRQAFVFGIPLALLELSLFGASIAYSSWLSPLQAVLISLPLYLVIPAVATYWFHHQRHPEDLEGGSIGFRVGLVGFAVFMLAIALFFAVIFLQYTFNPRKPYEWGLYDPVEQLRTLVTALGILAVLNGAGLLLSVIGGRIGEALATWQITLLEARGQRTS